MRPFVRFALMACGCVTLAAAADPEARLMRYPDISKTHVVFTYAGDLWTAPRAGGPAQRLTAHPGDETFAKFSPDGKWIAFTGEYDGNPDVYVIPSIGGEPKRLTFHPGQDGVLGWTPDGKKILFRSTRASAPPDFTRLFVVSPEGGIPEMLPVPRASLTSFSPDGQKIAYNTTSQEFRTWKRYRGGWTNYISLFDLKTNEYDEVPRSGAMQMFPMWYGGGIYYISDKDGTMNLYRFDRATKKTRKLTEYKEFDVKWPSLNGGSIVYENGGRLFYYDLEKNAVHPVPVTVASDLVNARAELKTVGQQVRWFGISPTGARAVVGARGEVFTVPQKDGSPRNLTDSPGVHELNPSWSPDGKWIAYLSDRSGEYEIYLRPQKGGDEVRITSDGECYRYGPFWSPDSKKLAFWDKKLRIYYVDIEQKQPVLVDTLDRRVEDNFPLDWSPDSRWIAYSRPETLTKSAVQIYSLEQKKGFRVSDGFYDDQNPVFDRSGKYLYFVSQRFFYPVGMPLDNRFGYFNTTGIFAVTLKADEASPFAPKSDEEKDAEEKKAADKDKKDEKKADDKKAEEKKTEEKPIQIDVDGIARRVVALPLPAGIYNGLMARKEKLFYLSQPMEALQAGDGNESKPRSVLHVYDMKAREDKVLLAGVQGYDVDKDGGKLMYAAPGMLGIMDAAPGKKIGEGKLALEGLVARVDPKAEWKQLFHEAWRIERDFYWDPAMGGLDWKKIGERYEALLPYIGHRSDLNYIIGELIAELSTSHTYVGGGDIPQRKRVGVGLLGADLEADQGYFRIKKIYKGENWDDEKRSPLTEPGVKVKEGDYLIAVNGTEAKAIGEPYQYFQGLAGKLTTLKINSKPEAKGAWEVAVKPVGNEGQLRYFDWVESRRALVDKATGGRVGYMHVPDTAISGLMAFDKYLASQVGKDGMIIDERYNHGGFIPDFYTEKLARRLLAVVSPREGKDVPWPPTAIYGPKVMIVNELAGSGGDCFPWFFQQQKIGPVVGTRTWGGLVGISREVPMMDGGNVTAPEVAFWSTEKGGQWIVENHGVDPDYHVEQRPDLEVQGHDPQLEKAIELVNQGMKDFKPLPPRPKFPTKTGVSN